MSQPEKPKTQDRFFMVHNYDGGPEAKLARIDDQFPHNPIAGKASVHPVQRGCEELHEHGAEVVFMQPETPLFGVCGTVVDHDAVNLLGVQLDETDLVLWARPEDIVLREEFDDISFNQEGVEETKPKNFGRPVMKYLMPDSVETRHA